MKHLLQYLSLTEFAPIIFGMSLVICYLMTPYLIGVAKYKELLVKPNGRSSHDNKTPTLGGIAFYISLVLCLFFLQHYDISSISFNIIVALTILFVAGLKDDLMVLGPRAKILAQVMAISFLLLNTDVHIQNWYGFLGLTIIPNWLNILFAYIVILLTINAYNLIDGIDGLAGLLGILIFSVFALVFYNIALYFYFLLSIVSIGFLLAFLRFNLSVKQKIFMGDTGSMIVGFLIGILTIRFLAISQTELKQIAINPSNLAILSLVILFLPLLDTLRVAAIRLAHNKKIYKADKNHIHHLFIRLGWSHLKVTILLVGYHSFIMILFFVLNLYLSAGELGLILTIISVFSLLFLFLINPSVPARKQKLIIRKTVKQSIEYKKIPIKKIVVGLFRILF